MDMYPNHSKIIAPTLDLFLYDLRSGLGENTDDIAQNRDYFKAKLPAHLHESLFDRDRDFEVEFVPLLEDKNGDKVIETFADDSNDLEGCYYPVRLGDSYGLLLHSSVKNSTELQPLFCLKDLKTYLTAKIADRPPSIGQTWMISAELPRAEKANAQEIAKACYNILMPDSDWERYFCGQGHFQGGYIFELWRYRLLLQEETKQQHIAIQDVQEDHHVIIALYPNAAAATVAADYSLQQWMRLFCYRTKTMWAYGQSRYLKERIKQNHVSIQDSIGKMEAASTARPKLDEIQNILAKAQQTQARYTIDLSNFQYQIKTMEMNLNNYQKRLASIREKAEPVKSTLILTTSVISASYASDLQFLEKFSDTVDQKYLLQVQKDYENFSPGIQLLEGLINAIASLRVVVETDQAQRDRTFQNQVAIWGIGLAAGSIVASISAQLPASTVTDKEKNNASQHIVSSYLSDLGVTKPWLTPVISTTMTVGITFMFAGVIWGILKLVERRSR